MFVRYLRAVGDAEQRKKLRAMMIARAVCRVAAAVALIAALAEIAVFSAVVKDGSAAGETAVGITAAVAVVAFIADIVLGRTVTAKLTGILSKPPADGESEEMTAYRKKLIGEIREDGEAFRRNVRPLLVGAVFLLFFVFIEACVFPGKEEMGTLSLVGTGLFAVGLAFTVILQVRYVLKKNAAVKAEDVKLAEKLDEAQGLPKKYVAAEDRGAHDLSYLFPTPWIRKRAEAAKSDYARMLSVNGVVSSVMALCVIFVFCSGTVFENALWGYAYPIFVTFTSLLIFLSSLQPLGRIKKIEKEQLKEMEGKPEFAKNLELYGRYKQYSKRKGKILLFALIASIVASFALAVPFPGQAWSFAAVAILVAGLFANKKFFGDFRLSVMPLEKEIDELNANRKATSDACGEDGRACVKRLEDMSLDELWELFPITLVDPEPEKWKASFIKEREELERILGARAARISHVGSTAVGTIRSKPIVDIIVETDDVAECASLLAAQGYLKMSDDGERVSLNKGYTPYGYADEVFHIHVRKTGDADERYFCAYLKENPGTAKEYEALKIRLLAEYGKDRDGYTKAKGEFVNRVTALARDKGLI